MSGVLLIIAGGVAAFYYLSTLTPPAAVSRLGRFEGRTIEGGRDIADTKQGSDYMPTVGETYDIDSQTGLPFKWVHKANGTRSKSFTDASGNKINEPKVDQA